MSTTKAVTVWCDADDCAQWTGNEKRTVKQARRDARREGWRHRRGKDFCPDHATEEP